MDILRELPDKCVDLIYLDPPFNSNHNYVAAFGDKGSVDAQLRDIWRWTYASESQYDLLKEGPLRNAIHAVRMVSGNTSPMAAYALFMGRRLAELYRVLKPTGSIYLHCDDTASYYLRIVMDAIFGAANARSAIVWQRYGAHNDAQNFGRVYDTVLYYAKSGKKRWNGAYTALDADYVGKSYRYEDEHGPYTTGPLHTGGLSGGGYEYEYKGFTRVWRFSKTRMRELEKAGRIHLPKKKGGMPRRKIYLSESKGKPVTNLWTDIPALTGNHEERVGYPTQKPLALLERIINASSNAGDFVLDPFCGCGTAADAAAKLGRKYLGIDVSAIAVRVMEQRLASRGGAVMPEVHRMGWEDYEWEAFERRALTNEYDAEDGLPGWAWAEDKVAGLLNAVPNSKRGPDGGIDGHYYTEAGEIIPIQVKMYRKQIGRPLMDKLLGVQARLQNQKRKAPMSLMVTLYPPNEPLRVYARQQGNVTLRGERYPKMQIMSVQEMLTKDVRPKLPPVDPRYFVGDTQTRLAIA